MRIGSSPGLYLSLRPYPERLKARQRLAIYRGPRPEGPMGNSPGRSNASPWVHRRTAEASCRDAALRALVALNAGAGFIGWCHGDALAVPLQGTPTRHPQPRAALHLPWALSHRPFRPLAATTKPAAGIQSPVSPRHERRQRSWAMHDRSTKPFPELPNSGSPPAKPWACSGVRRT